MNHVYYNIILVSYSIDFTFWVGNDSFLTIFDYFCVLSDFKNKGHEFDGPPPRGLSRQDPQQGFRNIFM